MDPTDRRIKALNKQLKRHHNPFHLERRGNWLYGRATLPPKPHLDRERPYQQRLALRIRATTSGVDAAEKTLIQLGAAVSVGEFDWRPWISTKPLPPPAPPPAPPTVGDMIEKFEENYWLRHPRQTSNKNTMRGYYCFFDRLPRDQVITLDLLIKEIAKTEVHTSLRKRICWAYRQLAGLAGLDITVLKELAGRYGQAYVSPRSLPSDQEIEAEVDRLFEVGCEWAWVVGIFASYGLRNHEVFHLDLTDYPHIFVGNYTKTGRRYVYPPSLPWLDRWDLANARLPQVPELNLAPDKRDNSQLGQRVSRAFRKHKLAFGVYDLRHAFARRCFENRFPPDLAAKVMGHSLAVHTKTYRAWWQEETYRKVYEQIQLERLL